MPRNFAIQIIVSLGILVLAIIIWRISISMRQKNKASASNKKNVTSTNSQSLKGKITGEEPPAIKLPADAPEWLSDSQTRSGPMHRNQNPIINIPTGAIKPTPPGNGVGTSSSPSLPPLPSSSQLPSMPAPTAPTPQPSAPSHQDLPPPIPAPVQFVPPPPREITPVRPVQPVQPVMESPVAEPPQVRPVPMVFPAPVAPPSPPILPQVFPAPASPPQEHAPTMALPVFPQAPASPVAAPVPTPDEPLEHSPTMALPTMPPAPPPPVENELEKTQVSMPALSIPEATPTPVSAPPTPVTPDPGVSSGRLDVTAASKIRLSIIFGPDQGRSIEFREMLNIGRRPGNQLVLTDGTTSGQHCRIERRGTAYFLVDLKSTNGTKLNDMPVNETELSDGDIVKLGQTVIRYEIINQQ